MVHIIVGPGNSGVFSGEQTRNRLRKLKGWIKVRVPMYAVACAPAGVERKLHKIC